MQNDHKRLAQTVSIRNPVVLFLLGGIFATLVILLLLIALNALGCGTSNSHGGSSRTGPNRLFSTPRPIGDPDRIKGVLKAGKTYRLVLKAGIEARVEDRAYTIKTVTNMVYVGEFVLKRRVEKNDGAQVVELRTFEKCRTVKLESHLEDLRIDWGLPGDLALYALDAVKPDTSAIVASVKPIVEGVLRSLAQPAADSRVQAWQSFDSLGGKTVRIVYQDGKGVVSLEPVACSLSPDEVTFLSNTASLSDYYLLPDVKVKPGNSWTVDAFQLSSLVDPSLRGVPRGEVVVHRHADDPRQAGKLMANLTIDRGYVELDSSDDKTSRIGSFAPRAKLLFNVTDGYLRQAELTGDIKIDRVSKDHLLFEASMRTQPKLQVQYHCTME